MTQTNPAEHLRTRSLYVNAVSTVVGGGLNDLVNTIPRLDARLRALGWQSRVWVSPQGWAALRDSGYHMHSVVQKALPTIFHRAVWELFEMPARVRREAPHALLHFSNFVLRRLNTRQIVVLRSQTFFSDEYRGTQRRGVYQTFRYHAGIFFSGRTLRLADTAFCISETHKSQVQQRFGALGRAAIVSHLGVAVPETVTEEQGPVQLSATQVAMLELVECAGPPIILNVSSYYEHKNLITLLTAIHRLVTRGVAIRLVLTAGILDYAGAENELTRKERAIAATLAQQGWLFDLGYVPKSVVWRLYRNATVFAFPSSVESFGHPLLEAMGIGIPVVASDTPIHREICDDAAVFHSTFQAEDLENVLVRLLNDSVLRRDLSALGQRRAATFSWDAHVESLVRGITRDQKI